MEQQNETKKKLTISQMLYSQATELYKNLEDHV